MIPIIFLLEKIIEPCKFGDDYLNQQNTLKLFTVRILFPLPPTLLY